MPAPGSPAAPLVTTKLVPPTRAGALVERPQLDARLASAAQRRLALVSAPAGSGKTSLLAHAWQATRDAGGEAAWISLDPADNDLARFLAYLVEALRRRQPLFGQATLTLLASGHGLPPAILRNAFLNELAALAQPLHLYLDDWHVIADPEVEATVERMLLEPLPRLHLAIGTRGPGRLPLARLRALGDLDEIGPTDLAFSAEEATRLFNVSADLGLGAAQIGLLRDRTEGWVAGLQLAAIALRDAGEPDAFIATFSGAHRNVGDFLAEEVFRRQEPEVRSFLLQTSILRQFSTALCNAVTGRGDARHLLDLIEERNLFLFSLDSEHGWYRYHHLFSAFLQKQLHELDAPGALECHRRACDWLSRHDLRVDAIEHAFAGDDAERAGRLLDAASPELFATGRTATLKTWAAQLPRNLARTLPQLQLELAWQNEMSWQFDAARAALADARRGLERRAAAAAGAEDPELEFLREKLSHREMMLALMRDDLDIARERGQQWLASHRNAEAFMEASAGSTLMVANREHFQVEGAGANAARLHRQFVECGGVYGTVFHDCIAGCTLFMRGDLDAAADEYVRARRTAVHLHGEGSALEAMPSAMLAELYYERGRLDEARALVARDEAVQGELGFVDNLIAGYLTRARLAALDHDAARAWRWLEDAEQAGLRYGFERLLACVLDERVRLALAAGEPGRARRLLESPRWRDWLEHPRPHARSNTIQETVVRASLRVALAEGIGQDEARLLRAWYRHTADRQCRRPAARLGALYVRAVAQREGDLPARRTLREVLALAGPAGFVRTFVDEGPALQALLAGCVADATDTRDREASCASRLLAAFAPGADAPAGGDVAGADGGLSLGRRERDLLALAAAGLGNRDIAAQLGLAESTVKWYWQRIFEQLGVRRRVQAVRKARHLGLLPA